MGLFLAVARRNLALVTPRPLLQLVLAVNQRAPRMFRTVFKELVRRAGPFKKRQDTSYRRAIPVAQRIAVSVFFLANGHTNFQVCFLAPYLHCPAGGTRK